MIKCFGSRRAPHRVAGDLDLWGGNGRENMPEWVGVSRQRAVAAFSPGISQVVACLVFPGWPLSRYLQSAGGKRRSREGPWICEAFAFPDAGVMKEGPVGPSWAYPGPSGTPVSVTRQLAGDGPAGPYRTPMPAVAAKMVAARFKVTRASPGTGS